jgi:hypothetical protein
MGMRSARLTAALVMAGLALLVAAVALSLISADAATGRPTSDVTACGPI